MAKVFKFGESFRPTKLERIIIGIQGPKNHFAFINRIETEVYDVLCQYSKNRPSLVFSATRKSCSKLADVLLKRYEADRANGKRLPWRKTGTNPQVTDKRLSALCQAGIAVHHAGLEPSDRRKIEDGFRTGSVMVIISTSTLAVGVNLPAHTVVVAGTKHWDGNGMVEYPDLDMQQMVGRAGRPQFDTHGQVVIMCDKQEEQKWRDAVESKTILESGLHEALTEHINSEISLRTIRNISDGQQWIRSSFLYVRIQQNPMYYAPALGHAGDKSSDWQEVLDDFIQEAVDRLHHHNLVDRGDTDTDDPMDSAASRPLTSTPLGDVMSSCFLSFSTMVSIISSPSNSTIEDLLLLLSSASEYSDLRPRQHEKTLLRKVNKSGEVRYPLPEDKCATSKDKVFLLIQVCLGAIMMDDFKDDAKNENFNPTLELFQIWKSATRICRAIVSVALERRDGGTLRSSLALLRTINGKAWEDTAVVLRQIEAIGPKSIKVLGSHGIRSFASLRSQHPSRLEMLLNRQVGFGTGLIESAKQLPAFTIEIKQTGLTHDQEADCVKIDFEVMFKVEGSLTERNKKKNTRARSRFISFLAVLSDGTYVSFRRINAKDFGDENKKIDVSASVFRLDQKLVISIGVDQLAGCSATTEFSPVVPSGLLPSLSEPDDGNHSEQAMLGATVFDFDQLESQDEQEAFNAFYTEDPPLQASVTMQEPVRLPNGNWKCKHTCKDGCNHACCHQGVKHKPKPRAIPRPSNTANPQIEVQKKEMVKKEPVGIADVERLIRSEIKEQGKKQSMTQVDSSDDEVFSMDEAIHRVLEGKVEKTSTHPQSRNSATSRSMKRAFTEDDDDADELQIVPRIKPPLHSPKRPAVRKREILTKEIFRLPSEKLPLEDDWASSTPSPESDDAPVLLQRPSQLQKSEDPLFLPCSSSSQRVTQIHTGSLRQRLWEPTSDDLNREMQESSDVKSKVSQPCSESNPWGDLLNLDEFLAEEDRCVEQAKPSSDAMAKKPKKTSPKHEPQFKVVPCLLEDLSSDEDEVTWLAETPQTTTGSRRAPLSTHDQQDMRILGQNEDPDKTTKKLSPRPTCAQSRAQSKEIDVFGLDNIDEWLLSGNIEIVD